MCGVQLLITAIQLLCASVLETLLHMALKKRAGISADMYQLIQIEMSHFSCPIRFEQPTKFAGPSGCVSCSRFGSLIF